MNWNKQIDNGDNWEYRPWNQVFITVNGERIQVNGEYIYMAPFVWTKREDGGTEWTEN